MTKQPIAVPKSLNLPQEVIGLLVRMAARINDLEKRLAAVEPS